MNHIRLLNNITSISNMLEKNNIPYHFAEETSLFIQGMDYLQINHITLHIQWDALQATHEIFSSYEPSDIFKDVKEASFTITYDEMLIRIHCHFNTTIRTNPYRISVFVNEVSLWCISIYGYLFNPHTSASLKDSIHLFLLNKQKAITANNNQAWNQNNYQALLNRYGYPVDVAKRIKENPEWRLYPFYKYMDNVKNKKVLHLMGSNGVKGVALSLLGAAVTIVDFSHENERFAKEIAQEAEVGLTYIISDVLHLPEEITSSEYDIVLMELGVLHYLLDLHPLFKCIEKVLANQGIFLLHEFHPISTKLITSSGKKHKVDGNYFNPSIESTRVAFSKHVDEAQQTELMKVNQRKWTLGEVVTALGQSGLKITTLEEEPNHKLHDIGIPKTYTIVAEK